MRDLQRKLLAMAIIAVVSAGAFAQKGKGRQATKPTDTKVLVATKEQPQQNNNQGKPKGNEGRKGRP
jgi:hypothetical protein